MIMDLERLKASCEKGDFSYLRTILKPFSEKAALPAASIVASICEVKSLDGLVVWLEHFADAGRSQQMRDRAVDQATIACLLREPNWLEGLKVTLSHLDNDRYYMALVRDYTLSDEVFTWVTTQHADRLKGWARDIGWEYMDDQDFVRKLHKACPEDIELVFDSDLQDDESLSVLIPLLVELKSSSLSEIFAAIVVRDDFPISKDLLRRAPIDSTAARAALLQRVQEYERLIVELAHRPSTNSSVWDCLDD